MKEEREDRKGGREGSEGGREGGEEGYGEKGRGDRRGEGGQGTREARLLGPPSPHTSWILPREGTQNSCGIVPMCMCVWPRHQ